MRKSIGKLTDEEKLKIILTDEEFIDRFWSYVDKDVDNNICWNWHRGPKNQKKYGLVRIKGNNSMNAHRVSLTMKLGYLPLADTLHSIDCKGNKRCVNPNHLRDGSESENRNDENISGKTLRQKNRRKELFLDIVNKSSESEKIAFYKYLQEELFPPK